MIIKIALKAPISFNNGLRTFQNIIRQWILSIKLDFSDFSFNNYSRYQMKAQFLDDWSNFHLMPASQSPFKYNPFLTPSDSFDGIPLVYTF